MKKTNKILLIVSVILALGLSGCSKDSKEKQNITISAAASLKEPLEEIKGIYEKENDVNITLNLGASGTLQKQIEQGADCDIYIPASPKQINVLEKKNLIKKDSKIDLLQNKLVIISNKNLDQNDSDLKFSIGTPKVVPAGDYAKESLENMGMYDKLKDKIIYAKDVKQVLSYVETNNVDFGMVYKSDALSSDKCKIYEVVDDNMHKPIIYPAAIVASTKNESQSDKFIKYLNSSKSKEIFKKYEFECVNN
ncbi:molybdate ABC transporter substrate-binding protein [Paraclostridium bifermentans]|uniref:molybdate ABC transporter substrate-binding protein n=1 Tax=Paraclostridium bifermentans TaxID=1490 RepID=UPI00290FA76B|nr:molybdate ABC transporter substrate-binding protein [Paraclostridium bifermentans]MDU3335323.1 molybdate ABC transporter substrate-binding protein [Paraclostridium bifermentans]